MKILQVTNLSKNFGKIQALQNVSFSVPSGVTFGILGPNGSGKTTLLASVMGIVVPQSGSFTFFDQPPTGHTRRKIGTLLETPNFYHYLNAVENLKISAAIKRKDPQDISRVLRVVGLYERRHSKFNSYSLGMKQRLAIASCLLGDPEVLVFDEPTNGLDPSGIAEIRQLMRQLHEQGKTIIMASHLLDEVEKVCTHVAILKNGNMIASGEVSVILSGDDIVEISSDDDDRLIDLLRSFQDVSAVERNAEAAGSDGRERGGQLRPSGKILVFFKSGAADTAKLNAFCHQNGITLTHLTLKRKSLESRFFELTNNN